MHKEVATQEVMGFRTTFQRNVTLSGKRQEPVYQREWFECLRAYVDQCLNGASGEGFMYRSLPDSWQSFQRGLVDFFDHWVVPWPLANEWNDRIAQLTDADLDDLTD